jgi:hypothetical protein
MEEVSVLPLYLPGIAIAISGKYQKKSPDRLKSHAWSAP